MVEIIQFLIALMKSEKLVMHESIHSGWTAIVHIKKWVGRDNRGNPRTKALVLVEAMKVANASDRPHSRSDASSSPLHMALLIRRWSDLQNKSKSEVFILTRIL